MWEPGELCRSVQPSAPRLCGECLQEALGNVCGTHGLATVVFGFLRDVLKVRHTVTGMLEQKDGLQLPASLIPLQKIREVQKEKHFRKYTFLKGWTYDRQKPSILANRLLTTAGAGFHLIQRPRQAEHLTEFQRYHHRPFLFYKSFFPLQHQSSTAILTLPHKSKAWIKRLQLN